MADVVLRLAEHIDQAILPLIALALGRKLALFALGPLLRAAERILVPRALAELLYPAFSQSRRLLLGVALAFFALDVLEVKTEIASCQLHPAPRTLALAAATALACFFSTSRLSTSMLCIIVLDCVKRQSVLATAAAAACMAAWSGATGGSLVLTGAAAFAADHFNRCEQPAGAALAVASVWLLATRGAAAAANSFIRGFGTGGWRSRNCIDVTAAVGRHQSD